MAASAASGNLCPFHGFGQVDDLAQPGVGGVAVPPGDVAADHDGLLAVAGAIGFVQGKSAQGGELGFDPVQP